MEQLTALKIVEWTSAVDARFTPEGQQQASDLLQSHLKGQQFVRVAKVVGITIWSIMSVLVFPILVGMVLPKLDRLQRQLEQTPQMQHPTTNP